MPHDPSMNPDNPNEYRRESHSGKVFFGFIALAVAVAAFAWLGRPSRPSRPEAVELRSRGKAPTITAAGWVNGEAPTPESLKGKVVLIEVWATWCGPCRESLPHLVEMHGQFVDRGVVFIGLTSEGAEKRNMIQGILDKAGAHWRTGWGADDTIRALGTEHLPSAYLIGKNGEIMWTSDDGGKVPAVLERLLTQTDAQSEKR